MSREVSYYSRRNFEKEVQNISDCVSQLDLSGSGAYGKRCKKNLEALNGSGSVFLTPSCSSAMEIVALSMGIVEDDEIILPSYSFPTCATAFTNLGARLSYVNVNPLTGNLSVEEVEACITDKTRAIIAVNYGGACSDLYYLKEIADRHQIVLLEDNAQSLGCTFKNKPLGSFGDFSVTSFHSTKNITSGGEGGALFVNNANYLDKVQVVYDKGTNRQQFLDGSVCKYTWVGRGGGFQMSEIQSAFLFAQLQKLSQINQKRSLLWKRYFQLLLPFSDLKNIEIQRVSDSIESNGHLFFLLTNTEEERVSLQKYLRQNGVESLSHFECLHTSEAGKKFAGNRNLASSVDFSKKIVRLPIHENLEETDVEYVCKTIIKFYR